ncbi:retrovirus-related pol polyprotein from transposon TNT 1-94 [Tanacetum coccineum]
MTRSSNKELVEPYDEPDQVLHSLRKLFKTTSFDHSSSPEFELFSDHKEQVEEEITETMTEPTMKEYMIKTREDYGPGVARPKFDKDAKFELKGQFLKELRDHTFSGSENEDANEHIESVLEIVDLFTTPDVNIMSAPAPKRVCWEIVSPPPTMRILKLVEGFTSALALQVLRRLGISHLKKKNFSLMQLRTETEEQAFGKSFLSSLGLQFQADCLSTSLTELKRDVSTSRRFTRHGKKILYVKQNQAISLGNNSPDDEENTRSSYEYLNDIEEEYQERALLAKSKRFFKNGTQRFNSAKATDQIECHKCGKKGHFARVCWSKPSVPSYQSPFQPKPLNSSQHKPELRPTKDFEAKYNKVKAKLALLSSSAPASKATTVKNKGLIAEAYEWDEE